MPTPIEREVSDALDPVLAVLRGSFQARMAGELAKVYLSGSAEMISWGRTQAGIPIAFEGPPIQQAIDWAREHAARLVTQVDEETKARIAQVVSDGIKNKRGVDGLARDIRANFADMTSKRSKLIAKTETANSLGEAFIDRGKAMGITAKEWITIGDDRVSDGCRENEGAGVIPFNQAFPSGDMRPPRFPGCRCAAVPARVGE